MHFVSMMLHWPYGTQSISHGCEWRRMGLCGPLL